MNRTALRRMLMGAALLVGIGSAAFGASRAPAAPVPAAVAPMSVSPFDLAHALSVQAPDTVVITLGKARHALEGAMPSEAFGPSDDDFVARAPVARRIILAGGDPVRTDRVARRLMATGHDVRVVEGGIDAWDKAMDSDPPPPPQGAEAAQWEAFQLRVALRRRFGVQDSSPAPVIAAPPLPAAGTGASTAPKKREGC